LYPHTATNNKRTAATENIVIAGCIATSKMKTLIFHLIEDDKNDNTDIDSNAE